MRSFRVSAGAYGNRALMTGPLPCPVRSRPVAAARPPGVQPVAAATYRAGPGAAPVRCAGPGGSAAAVTAHPAHEAAAAAPRAGPGRHRQTTAAARARAGPAADPAA